MTPADGWYYSLYEVNEGGDEKRPLWHRLALPPVFLLDNWILTNPGNGSKWKFPQGLIGSLNLDWISWFWTQEAQPHPRMCMVMSAGTILGSYPPNMIGWSPTIYHYAQGQYWHHTKPGPRLKPVYQTMGDITQKRVLEMTRYPTDRKECLERVQ